LPTNEAIGEKTDIYNPTELGHQPSTKRGDNKVTGKLKWLFGKNSDLYPANMPSGMWFWLVRRITGLVLVIYLFAHLYILTNLWKGEGSWSESMELMTSDLFVFLDFLLIGAVIAHTVTGAAVILFDMGIGVRKYKVVYWVLLVIGLLLFIGAGYAAWYIITG